MTRPTRFRFSLSTLLLAVVWSAVVVWLNTTAGEVRVDDPNAPFGPGYRWLHYGWPLAYAWDVCPINVPPNGVHFAWYSWALVGDAAVGVLMVAVLTWGSRFVVRRVKHVFSRANNGRAGLNRVPS
jgi:hypothetical protein